MSEFRGDLHARGRRFAIAVARFNEIVTRKLLDGALAALDAHGVAAEDIDVVWVPGAFELPLAAMRLARSRTFDAVVCLGAVDPRRDRALRPRRRPGGGRDPRGSDGHGDPRFLRGPHHR